MIRDLLSSTLRRLADDIDGGNCNMSESDMLSAFEQLREINDRNSYMSKYDACRYLGVSRATFDRMVADGKIPQGKKRAGFKELSWAKKDLKI